MGNTQKADWKTDIRSSLRGNNKEIKTRRGQDISRLRWACIYTQSREERIQEIRDREKLRLFLRKVLGVSQV